MLKMDTLILQSEGRFVTVEFIKKDGSTRVLTGRLGVKKHLKGGVSTLNPDEYITLFDVQKSAYRAVNRATIKRVTIDGLTVSKGI